MGTGRVWIDDMQSRSAGRLIPRWILALSPAAAGCRRGAHGAERHRAPARSSVPSQTGRMRSWETRRIL